MTANPIFTASPTTFRCALASVLALSAIPAVRADALVDDWLLSAAASFEDTDEWYFGDIPAVLTPARLRQPRSEVPASVTVITAEDIQRYGIRNLHDVFRLVPGMTVGYVGSNVPSVSYHGTNANEQRRLQVRVDGRSVYNPNLASVDWLNIPVALEDIARIEVTRGPNTAAYGANSFLGVINIITHHPSDSDGARLVWKEGDIGERKRYARWGDASNRVQYRVSVHDKNEEGFDFRRDGTTPFNDAYDLQGANLSIYVPGSATQRWYLDAGFLNGDQNVQRDEGDGQVTDPNIRARDNYVSARYEADLSPTHTVQILAYTQKRNREQPFRACVHPVIFSDTLSQLYASNQQYGSILVRADATFLGNLAATISGGGSPGIGTAAEDMLALQVINEMVSPPVPEVCGNTTLSIRERRNEFEVQSTWTPNPQWRLVSGLSYRKDTFYSDTYFGGAGGNEVISAFFSQEYRPTRDWLIHFGGMAEDDQSNGFNFSPRAALHYRIGPYSTLRAVISHAIRTPDTYEQSASWSFRVTDLDPPLNGASEARTFLVRSPGGLDNEQIVAREIGYYLNLPHKGIELDVKVFRDNLWDLISAPLSYFSFEPENNLSLEQTGVEVESTWRANRFDTLRLTYAYLDQDEEYTGQKVFLPNYTGFPVERLFAIESRLTAQHSGSLGWTRTWSDRLDTTLVYYLAETIGVQDYRRGDVIVSWKQPLSGGSSVAVSGKIEHYLSGDTIMYRDNRYKDTTHYFVGVALDW
ncbi:MAG: hypothetical protein D6758_12620 [Gammaproteobacteria bacterium]|nr:MAG: hypothetical protein D6758_12620 [Gammaproteobacteria bacterium]